MLTALPSPFPACPPQVPGINHYENVIEAVYGYWKAKHERAGRPLIQRLWYEPPWDRKKAAQRLASSAADGEGGASEGGPFYAQDSPAALAGIRKRRMDPEEVKARFQEMRCGVLGVEAAALVAVLRRPLPCWLQQPRQADRVLKCDCIGLRLAAQFACVSICRQLGVPLPPSRLPQARP